MIRKTISRVLKPRFFGKQRYQRFWEKLHGWSLEGMNLSGDGSIDVGEIWVLKYIAARLRNEGRIVIFDVGANTGRYSAEAVGCFGANLGLYAFEPALETFELLRQNLASFENVQCFNFGFGDCEESRTLYSFAGQSGLSSVYDRFHLNQSNGNSSRKKEEVIGLKTVDGFCAEQGIKRVMLLKLDVEGHELKILHGARRLIEASAIDFIQFEFGGTNVDSRTFLHDFVDVLSPNYKLYRILKDGLGPMESYSERFEIFQYSNYLAVSKSY